MVEGYLPAFLTAIASINYIICKIMGESILWDLNENKTRQVQLSIYFFKNIPRIFLHDRYCSNTCNFRTDQSIFPAWVPLCELADPSLSNLVTKSTSSKSRCWTKSDGEHRRRTSVCNSKQTSKQEYEKHRISCTTTTSNCFTIVCFHHWLEWSHIARQNSYRSNFQWKSRENRQCMTITSRYYTYT